MSTLDWSKMITEDEFVQKARKCPCLKIDSGRPSVYKSNLKKAGGTKAVSHIVVLNSLGRDDNVIVAVSSDEGFWAPFYFFRTPKKEELIKAADAIEILFGRKGSLKLAGQLKRLFDSQKNANLSVGKNGEMWIYE